MTLPDLNALDIIVPILWHYNLVADIETVSDGVIKTFVRNDELMVEDGDFKLIMTTADERVDMLKSVIYETLFSHEPFFDFVTFSPSTGNKNYIEWVKKQTLTLDGNKPEYPEDDDDHPDSMEGVPDVQPGEENNSTVLESATAPATFFSVNATSNKTIDSKV